VTLTLEFLDEALDEVEEASRWYARRSASSAVGFSDTLALAVWQIQQTPFAWSPHLYDTRRLILRRFPYSMIYRVDSVRIVIVAVAHNSRRPGYWRDRLDDS